MSTKLFVGGLPWAMDNNRLKEVFAECGDVADARVILDRETGRSRGFGFVTYADEEGATRALDLDGREIDGRRIRVDRATEKERSSRGGGGRPRPEGDRGGGGRPGPGPGTGRDFGGGAPAPSREREGGGAPPGGAAPGRSRGGGAPSRREFNDDWGGGGGGDRDRGRRAAGKGKGRGRRRGGRGGRGAGEEHDVPPAAGGSFDDFDDWE